MRVPKKGCLSPGSLFRAFSEKQSIFLKSSSGLGFFSFLISRVALACEGICLCLRAERNRVRVSELLRCHALGLSPSA